MENKSKQKTIWKVWPGMKSHPWNFKDQKVVENVELALIYRQVKKICRKCNSKLPPNATKCRNKKCHCNWFYPGYRVGHSKNAAEIGLSCQRHLCL